MRATVTLELEASPGTKTSSAAPARRRGHGASF
jgi:hypothetical protein